MFGFDAAALVKHGKWEKLAAAVEKYGASKCEEIATACAASSDDGAYNTLITMLNSDDAACKMAAVKALAKQGRPAAITQLMYQAKNADEALKTAINDAMEELHKAGKE